MPVFHITAPDGTTYEVNGPDGASEQDALAYVKSQHEKQASSQSGGGMIGRAIQGTADRINALREGIQQGVTLGAADEISAGMKTPLEMARQAISGQPVSISGAYDKALGENRASLDEAKKHPWFYGAGVMGGSVAPALGTMAVLPTAATLPGIVGQGALSGGATGLISGFLSGEGGAENRLNEAGATGTVGAVLGGTLPLMAQGVARVGKGVYDQFRGRLSGTRTDSGPGLKIAEAIMRDIRETSPNASPQEVMAAARSKLAELGETGVVADIGSNTRGLAGAISRLPGQGKTSITDFVTARQEGTRGADSVLQGGQFGRLNDLLDSITPTRFRAGMDALDAKRVAEAAPLYKEAFQANPSVTSKEIDAILETPAGQRAFREAVEMMQNSGKNVAKPIKELTELAKEQGIKSPGGVGSGLNMETLDYIKRALDDNTSTFIRAGEGNKARISGNLARNLAKEMEALDVTAKAGPNSFRIDGGALQRGRQAYAGPSQLMDAMELGQQYAKGGIYKSPDEMVASFAKLTPDEQGAAKVGFIQHLRDTIGSLPTTRDATAKFLNIPGMETKIKTIFGDADTFQNFIKTLGNESKFYDLYAEVMKGSPTASRLAAHEDLMQNAPGITDAAQLAANPTLGNLLRTGGRLFSDLYHRAVMPEPARNRMAELLMKGNTAEIEKALLLQQANARNNELLARAITQGLAPNTQGGR